MKKQLILLLALFCIAIISSCGDFCPGCDEVYIWSHGKCDQATFKSYCDNERDRHLFECIDGELTEYKCEQYSSYRCIEDVLGAACQSNNPDFKPDQYIFCQHDPDGDGKDYKIILFQNASNNNYWEYGRELISDGICKDNQIISDVE